MVSELERRSGSEVGAHGRRISGYAVVFNQPADLDSFVEIVEPSAVDRTLQEQIDVRALADHDPSTRTVLGRLSAGTLRLTKDTRGLRFEIDMPDTTVGRDLLESVSRRDVRGASFRFDVVKPTGERWEQRGRQLTRVLSDLRIPEISIVSFPAYVGTEDVTVAIRSLRAFQAQQPSGTRVDWLRKLANASAPSRVPTL